MEKNLFQLGWIVSWERRSNSSSGHFWRIFTLSVCTALNRDPANGSFGVHSSLVNMVNFTKSLCFIFVFWLWKRKTTPVIYVSTISETLKGLPKMLLFTNSLRVKFSLRGSLASLYYRVERVRTFFVGGRILQFHWITCRYRCSVPTFLSI